MANEILPVTYLARHGETEWSRDGRHTGLTDLPLTEQGERNAQRLRERLTGLLFVKVLTSPLQRARRTSELAGVGGVGRADPDLFERSFTDEQVDLVDASVVKLTASENFFACSLKTECPRGNRTDSV